MRRIILAVVLSLAVLGAAWVVKAQGISSFIMIKVKFDDTRQGPGSLAKIPKGWKLVAVEKGTHTNDTDLWFLDESGNIIVAGGYMDSVQFIMKGTANEIEVEK